MTNFVMTRPEKRELKTNPVTGKSEGAYWGQYGGPIADLRERDGKSRTVAEYHFADHAYRVKEDDGTLIYYAEPYNLTDEDQEDLDYLRSKGWVVDVADDGPNRHSEQCLLLTITKA